MAKIGIIGAGSWGIALSVLLHNNGHEITVWSILEDEINMLKTEHEHKDKPQNVSNLPPIAVPSLAISVMPRVIRAALVLSP